MKKSNLLQILSAFSAVEIKEFSDYVRSPFLNKNKGAVKLFDHIRKEYPEFKTALVDKTYVWRSVFHGTEYNDGSMRFLMFTLTNLAMDYLQYKELDKDKFLTGNYLLKALNERELVKQFEKQSGLMLERYKENGFESETYNYNRYLLELENVHFLQKRYFDRNEKILEHSSMNNIARYADLFNIIVALKSYLYLLNTRQLYETGTDTKDFEEFLSRLDLGKFTDVPLVSALFHTIKLLTDENNTEHFILVRNSLFSNFSKLQIGDSIEFIINIENYCKRMIRKGRKEFINHLFEMYQFELEHKTYRAEHSLSDRMYQSIVETAISLGKHKWAAVFIEEYKGELQENMREGAYNYANAFYEFSKNNFEESAKLLLSAKYNDVYNKFRVKTLLISCYYELNMFDKMEWAIDSYRHLLSSDRFISKERKKYYSNFILIAKKLIKLKTHFNPVIANDIRELISKPGFVLDAAWVENKISELELKFTSTSKRKHSA